MLPAEDLELLVPLVMDMHVAEAAMSKVPEKYKDSLRLSYRSQIAGNYNLEEWELDSLLLHLQEDPSRYRAVTKMAMARLDSLERTMH